MASWMAVNQKASPKATARCSLFAFRAALIRPPMLSHCVPASSSNTAQCPFAHFDEFIAFQITPRFTPEAPDRGPYFREVGQVYPVHEPDEPPERDPPVPNVENWRSISPLPHLLQTISGFRPIGTRTSITSPHF